MRASELFELIQNGEDSRLEFKHDLILNEDVAKELVALLNHEGGTVLLGVEDSGEISGTKREKLDEWVTELCRTQIEPPINPSLSWVMDAGGPGQHVLAVRVTMGPDKPYARVHSARRTYFIRVGSTCREASRDELELMFQRSAHLRYGRKPVPGADFAALDIRRLTDYFGRVLKGIVPPREDVTEWHKLLLNLDLMTTAGDQTVVTIDGMLLFGTNPKRFVAQSGIRALCFPGTEKDYATNADSDLKGPLLPLCAADGSIVESGLVEQAWDFVRRNTTPSAYLEGARRIDRWDYPEAVIREAVVNALVHRDYSIAGTDVLLTIYADRLEVVSPGRLPNTVSTEGMKAGMRYARNQTLVNVMRDYRYVDFRGMGVKNKIIPGMRAHNGTEPEFIAEESRLIVRLWK